MRTLFADTFYFIALLDKRDAAHAAAVAASRQPRRRFVTTEYVLIELGDALNEVNARGEFDSLFHVVNTDPTWEIIPSSHSLFRRGLELFRGRPDKDWGLTDCISFAVMKQRHLREALTGDHHFEQAGFKPLLA